MPDDVAIKVSHVSKDFRFSSHRSNTLKSLFTGITHKKDRDEKIQHALKDIDFEIKKGEFFGIVGRNGSGKSTLLKIMAGIYQPNKGKVQVAGKLVPFIELGVGFNPDLTGKENVYMNGALLGFNTKEIDTFYNEVVEFAELEKFMDKKLKNYSSGMQVRLAFSMAIRAKADVLLIDEVLAVGDADFQRKCFDYFKGLKKKETTVIFVSHDMDAVRQFCDRAMLINDSEVKMIGDVNDVSLGYTKLFLGAGRFIHKDDTNRIGKEKIIRKLELKIAENINIKGELSAKESILAPHFGIIIRDARGVPVMGTSSKLLKININKLSSSARKTFDWSVENILSDGEYTLDIALTGSNGIDVLDWWNSAIKFNVKRSSTSPYPITPKFKLKMEDI